MTLDKKEISIKAQASDGPMDGCITEAITARQKDGTLSCAEAFDIAQKLGVDKIEVGRAMDRMKVKIVKCQLGLFGHKEGKRVTPDAFPPQALLDALSLFRKEGRMPCNQAHEIARELGVGRPAVANACEAFGIKITPCQLGAF